ncbi:MAG: ABC transporter permease [Alicyclobacillaceae bacterium]|nr:ABC transporter permease [Alicyclobacillaceae bacterium]
MNATVNSAVRERMHVRFLLSDAGPLLALILLMAIGSMISPVFLSKGNLYNILSQIAVLGVGALGMTYVMISGFFDLSVGGVLSLAGVLVVGLQPSFGFTVALLAVVAMGVGIGCANGLLLRTIRGDFGASIMITFGVGTILAAVALLYSNGYSMTVQYSRFLSWLERGGVAGIPAVAVVLMICAAVLHVILRYTVLGRYMYLAGASARVALSSGVPVYTIRTIALCMSALMAVIGGLMETAQTASASPVAGVGYELDVVAAVAIGGTSLSGGWGSVVRTIVGVLLVGVLNNVLILVGLSTPEQMIAQGLIILVALITDRQRKSNLS